VYNININCSSFHLRNKLFFTKLWKEHFVKTEILNLPTSQYRRGRIMHLFNKGGSGTIIVIHAQIPFFRPTIFFTFQVQSLFKQAPISLAFLPCNVRYSKQAAVFSFPTISSSPSSQRSDIFLIRSVIFLWSNPSFHFVYKAPFPKQ